jgi:hypothetical protein
MVLVCMSGSMVPPQRILLKIHIRLFNMFMHFCNVLLMRFSFSSYYGVHCLEVRCRITGRTNLYPNDCSFVVKIIKQAEEPLLFGAGKPDTTNVKDRLTTLLWLRETYLFIIDEGFQFAMAS